jgi:hypothetical protein
MERQVETINKLVSSYMQIVAKMTRDYIPKAIMFNIVQNVGFNHLFCIASYLSGWFLGTKICIKRIISTSICTS